MTGNYGSRFDKVIAIFIVLNFALLMVALIAYVSSESKPKRLPLPNTPVPVLFYPVIAPVEGFYKI